MKTMLKPILSELFTLYWALSKINKTIWSPKMLKDTQADTLWLKWFNNYSKKKITKWTFISKKRNKKITRNKLKNKSKKKKRNINKLNLKWLKSFKSKTLFMFNPKKEPSLWLKQLFSSQWREFCICCLVTRLLIMRNLSFFSTFSIRSFTSLWITC